MINEQRVNDFNEYMSYYLNEIAVCHFHKIRNRVIRDHNLIELLIFHNSPITFIEWRILKYRGVKSLTEYNLNPKKFYCLNET